MKDEVTTMVEPNNFGESAKWVLTQIQKREQERYPRAFWHSAPDDISKQPTNICLKSLKGFKRLEMGFSAFSEAKRAHASLGIWAEDWCDGCGPRVRIGGLVAQPTEEIDPWAIRLT